MAQSHSIDSIDVMQAKLEALRAARTKGLSRKHCLRLWSEFIRERDGHRCVDCHSRTRLSAHHICRKSFVEGAQFETGNGITLCDRCHREIHVGFNGRPDLMQPADSQGGEKLPLMERLYSILTDDAVERALLREDFYFLSDTLLNTFKEMQGYRPTTYFPGSRVEQAYLILAECEFSTRRALAEANGAPVADKPLLPGGLYLVINDGQGRPRESIIIQRYVVRWTPRE